MRWNVLVVLAGLTFVHGCANPFVKKADTSVAPSAPEQHPDQSLALQTVPENATYSLILLEHPNTAPLANVPCKRGDRIGFRTEKDGPSFALAGKETILLPEGRFGWVMIETNNSLRERHRITNDVVDGTIKVDSASAVAVGVAAVVALAIACHASFGPVN